MTTLSFPMQATIGGVEVVIVLASEYDRLRGLEASPSNGLEQPLKTSLTVDQMLERLHARGGPRRKLLLLDIEIARFLVAKLDEMMPADVRQACIERFGIERTPSGYPIERMAADVCEERSKALRFEALGNSITAPQPALPASSFDAPKASLR